MIKNRTPLSMAESLEFIKGDGEREKEIRKFIKDFTKTGPEEAKKIRKKIEDLNLLKVKPKNIASLIDIMPGNSEDLNKIFSDVNLDEDETNKIFEALEEFK